MPKAGDNGFFVLPIGTWMFFPIKRPFSRDPDEPYILRDKKGRKSSHDS